MRAEVLSWCRREALFSPGAQVVCAVSGGADSMAMLCCLRELAAELSVYVRAAHFNHRLRGAESDGDEAFVRAFCAAEGIELVCGAPEKPARSEEEAREQRYAFLDSIPCDAIAVAHTAEDNLETLLQHLLRGSGLRGLGGIPPRRGRYVRPLLAVSHAQAREYLRARGTGWREDATNAEDGCQRNRLRHGVLPLLAAETPELPLRVT
ncbi:MAG: tRNA lysidine(34) synthetase TilS, partial [Oscillospiraceae bacterium]|nr:tRNA lysidine(34) synthetase TilS [Oscillospiraceae bacterium]